MPEWASWEMVRAIGDVLTLVGVVLVGVYSWARDRHREASDALADLQAKRLKDKHALNRRVKDIEDRVLVTEQTIRHMPDSAEVRALERRLGETSESLAETRATLSEFKEYAGVLGNKLDLIQEYLLRGGARD